VQNGVACADNCKCNDCLNILDGMADRVKGGGCLERQALAKVAKQLIASPGLSRDG